MWEFARLTSRLTCLWLLTMGVCRTGEAQQRKTVTHTRNDIAALTQEIKFLEDKQLQMIDELNVLEKLLQTRVASPTSGTAPLPVSMVIQREPFRGDSSARIAIIEYADFECPYCGTYEREVFPEISDNYIRTGKVKYFFRDLPSSTHPFSMSAARAARCAGEQGKFWEMHDSLFAKQTALSAPALLDRAQTLGLDAAKFAECQSSEKYTADIQKSVLEAQKMGIDGTPTFFIGTIDGDTVRIKNAIQGGPPFEVFKTSLDALLASKTLDTISPH
jgi:protein-disulfide isomerase